MTDISAFLNQQLPFQGGFSLVERAKTVYESESRLSEEEQKELRSFTNQRRQQEYLTSRLELRKLAGKMNIAHDGFKVLKDENGRPYGVCNSDHYFVSIAHTKNKVFCGLTSHAAIGVDLELVNRKVPSRLKKRILHLNEAPFFEEMDTIRLWTIKESFIKLRGQGLRLNMNQVLIERKKDTFYVRFPNEKEAEICSFRSEAHWLAVAYYI